MTVRSDHEKMQKGDVTEIERETSKRSVAEQTLRESQKRLSQIVQGSPIPTFVIDHKHVVVHCNRAFENLTGIPAKEVIGTKKQWLAFYPAKRPVLADLIVDGATEEEIAGYYGRTYRHAKTIEGAFEAEAFFSNLWEGGKWLFFTAAPLKDDDGRIIGAIETLQDISEQKRTEEALRKSEQGYRTLLDFLPSPVVLFTTEGKVAYFNAAFTETFGWSLEELRGKKIPYVPPDRENETVQNIRRLFREKRIIHHESKRLTKDGRTLDVSIKATVYAEAEQGPTCELVILQDISRKKKIARNNEAILRISRALPEYPDLEELLDYINGEVKRLLDTEGAVIILRDEEDLDLYVVGAAYDATDTQVRVKKIRFSPDQLVAGRVIKNGEPLIINDISDEPELHRERDKRLGYTTRNLLLVPLKSIDRIIGVLCGINKKQGDFEEADRDLLNMISGTVALSIENARFSEEIKKAYRINEALLRISTALPEYPDLEELLDYVSNEVKRILLTEGALVILPDAVTDELYFLGVSYDDPTIQSRVKEIRFPMDQLVAGKVIRRGQPLIINDTSEKPELHRERDKRLGYTTRNLLLVPLKSIDRIIGVLCGINKKQGDFEEADRDLLNMISGTVALSIENARFSEEIKKAYREVTGLNRAKDKVINHLSHELKTPVSILATNLKILEKKLCDLREDTWKRAMERAQRNLNRILEIQYKAHDIMQDKRYEARDLLSRLLDQCTDELETLVAEQVGDLPLIDRVRRRIEEIYSSEELIPQKINLSGFFKGRLDRLKPQFSHRRVEITIHAESDAPVYVPREVLEKVIDGLIKNAVENTPDDGKIEVLVRKEDRGWVLTVHDYGVGITEESQNRIFEGFFTTQDTLDYSSKNPFDFNAGGKGTDLLRMKIFSERYGFSIRMSSSRCRFIPMDKDQCPGRITRCGHCHEIEDCHRSGETIFSVHFSAPQEDP